MIDDSCDMYVYVYVYNRKGGDTKVRSVESRAAEIVGMTPEFVEPLQVRTYLPP